MDTESVISLIEARKSLRLYAHSVVLGALVLCGLRGSTLKTSLRCVFLSIDDLFIFR